MRSLLGRELVPEISRFYGITIRMWYDDHEPPHFHARYGGHEVVVAIKSLTVVRGRIPRRARALALEWATLHRAELLEDWELARAGQPLRRIAPLE